MKSIRSFLIGIIVSVSLVASMQLLHAQTAVAGNFNNGLTLVQAAAPDSIVQILADANGLELISPGQAPRSGTFWTVTAGGSVAPYPCPPLDLTVPVYQLGDQWLVDESGGAIPAIPRRFGMQAQTASGTAVSGLETEADTVMNLITRVQATTASQQMQMMSGGAVRMYVSGGPVPGFEGGGGSDTNGFYSDSFNFHPDYGTNLWLATTNLAAGYLSGVVSNTTAGIQYELQYKTDLSQSDWQSAGWFTFGSETTNWTAWSVPTVSSSNLFLRVRSWADDGSGLPLWWQLEYFNTTGVDPYGDPMSDGWNNLQKFQNGMNPKQFYTPPAPQGVTVNYNSGNNTAAISWLPSPSPVVSYTIETPGGNHTVSATTLNFTDTSTPTTDWSQGWNTGPTAFGSYRVYANYAGGSSALSDAEDLEPGIVNEYYPTIPIYLIPGPQGSAYVAASSLPAGTVALRVTRFDEGRQFAGLAPYHTNFDILVSDVTNGLYLIPPQWYVTPGSLDPLAGGGAFSISDGAMWWVQAINTNGGLSAGISSVDYHGNYPYSGFWGFSEDTNDDCWLVAPYFDGRAQLKQNLIFKLRAATKDFPFEFSDEDGSGFHPAYTNQTNYVLADYFQNNPTFDCGYDNFTFDPLWPFAENALLRNFVFSLDDVYPSGYTDTGDGGSLDDYYNWPYNPTPLILTEPAKYRFALNTTNGATIPSLLPANNTQWLCSYALDSPEMYRDPVSGAPVSDGYLDEIGITNYFDDDSNKYYTMFSNARNYWGLPFVSAKIAWGNTSGADFTLSSGNTEKNIDGYFYAETAQPQFQTVEYDFWNSPVPWQPVVNSWPGNNGFSTTNTSAVLITSVGNANYQVLGYAKLAVLNGYSGVYGYLGQYFTTNAYALDASGNITTNTTGILSPYGSFFATEPGPAALVTMPDIDTGQRGTGTVYSVSVAIDRAQGSNMDLSFNGANATSINNPALIWANNNFDRGHTVDGSDFEQDDLGSVDIAKLPAYQRVPDCNYVNAYGQPAIPSTRDLEDYFRLWTPGLTALMKVLPANYTVQLTSSGEGQIRIFQAIEPDGGTNYLFDETTASNQVVNSASLYVGLLTSFSPIILPFQTNFNEHFIFCGAQTGSAQIDLQVLDGNGNVVADSPVYLQVKDIKNMYERWTVGDNPNTVPMSVAKIAANDLPDPTQPPFQYALPQDASTPYILFVHGWNMEPWEKDSYAEAAFKRLYWQGYKGRFGSFRWPTGYDFGSWKSVATDPDNFDNSEFKAWFAGLGLLNKLTDLNNEYPGNVYLMAHSMGNVVAGEALRLAGNNQVVNTYIAMQAAVPAHAYDPSTPTRLIPAPLDSSTPNRYAYYYTDSSPCYFNGSAGAETYVNFFNASDFALDKWTTDQNLKPDLSYSWNGTHFFAGSYQLNFPQDTYQIFAYCDEARCSALGAQADVGGAFQKLGVPQEVDLFASPFNFGDAHKYHSAEFRSDNAQRSLFWNTVLLKMKLKEE